MKIYVLDEDGKWVYLGESEDEDGDGDSFEPDRETNEVDFGDVSGDWGTVEIEIALSKAMRDWAYNVGLLQRGDLN